MSKLIIGCGYVGLPLAHHWLREGVDVHATTRSTRRAREFERLGIRPVVFDVTQPNVTPLPVVETVVFAVGFDRLAGNSIEQVYVQGLSRALALCHEGLETFIYVSSTGVYGDADGAWVEEDTPCAPNRAGGKACLQAEQLLSSHPTFRDKALILRMAGIYGLGRLPLLEKLKQGEPLAVAANGYLNLVHVDDIVRIISECDRRRCTGTFNVSDGHPVQRSDFYTLLAELTGSPAPAFETPLKGSSRAERARGSKRISNRRLLNALQTRFMYPTYREGLQSIVQSDATSQDK